MDISKVPQIGLLMQDSVSCDYNRTPVKFQGSDIFVFVGDIVGFAPKFTTTISGMTDHN